MKKNFAFLDEMIPGIRWDAKYATWDNFTGKPVDGYMVNRIVGTKELGAALRKAQKAAEKLGYGLLLWDGYRPQCAVDCFLNWASLPENNLTKKQYNIKSVPIAAKTLTITGHLRQAKMPATSPPAIPITGLDVSTLNTAGKIRADIAV